MQGGIEREGEQRKRYEIVAFFQKRTSRRVDRKTVSKGKADERKIEADKLALVVFCETENAAHAQGRKRESQPFRSSIIIWMYQQKVVHALREAKEEEEK
jgi:hypothetical protein